MGRENLQSPAVAFELLVCRTAVEGGQTLGVSRELVAPVLGWQCGIIPVPSCLPCSIHSPPVPIICLSCLYVLF